MIAIALQSLGIDCGLRRLERAGQPIWRRLAPLTRRLLPANTPLRALALGGLWGYLPCGLIYTMLLAAMASHSPWQGAQLLVGFGLGTAPAMLGAARLSIHLKQLPVRRLGATLLLLSGVWTAGAPWLIPHDHGQGQHHGQTAMTNPLKPALESPPNGQSPSHLPHSP
jgi:sulfite exporter TauE/SafE